MCSSDLESTRRSVQEEWVSACRRSATGSSAISAESAATAGSASAATNQAGACSTTKETASPTVSILLACSSETATP